jgi:hypothetical protein
MMDTIELFNDDEIPAFNKVEWIGKGKEYPQDVLSVDMGLFYYCEALKQIPEHIIDTSFRPTRGLKRTLVHCSEMHSRAVHYRQHISTSSCRRLSSPL